MKNPNLELENEEMLAWLRKQALLPGISRTKLARLTCERLDWRDAKGSLQEMSCRKRLLQLDRSGLIKLPIPLRARPVAKPLMAVELCCVDAQLAELGKVELVCVTGNRQYSPIWNALMQAHHPLGCGPLCGAQLRYLVKSEHHGWLGGLAFSAAACRLQARDTYLGWNDKERSSQLRHIVCNSRFLILPTVRVAHLASHVLGMGARRLSDDWQAHYGYRPWMLETFIDADRQGTCYRAANWIDVGPTAGRSRQDTSRTLSVGVKRVLLYPLEPQRFPLLGCSLAAAVQRDWADEEFDGLPLEKRLVSRVKEVARDFFARPSASIAGACAAPARTKGAYRLFEHKKVGGKDAQMNTLLCAHYEATTERVSQEPLVLMANDTTSFNFSGRPGTTGLGNIGSKVDGPIGMLMHETMAFTPDGVPLGLTDVQCWVRKPEDFGKNADRGKLDIEEKESFKWLKSFEAAKKVQAQCPQTQVVVMGDRESDVYELFKLAQGEKTKFLVRAEQNRCINGEQAKLRSHMAALPVAGEIDILVGRRKAKAVVGEAKETSLGPVKDLPACKTKAAAGEARETPRPVEALPVGKAKAVAGKAKETSKPVDAVPVRKAKAAGEAKTSKPAEALPVRTAKAVADEVRIKPEPAKDLPARTARVTVRYGQVQLCAPKSHPHLGPVDVWAVWGTEENPPPDAEALDWLLLTTVPTLTFEDACTRLRWYAKRWGVEIYHRILKSGCRFEDRQLRDVKGLKACLAIDLVVAWRIMQLVHLGRQVPEMPCTVFF